MNGRVELEEDHKTEDCNEVSEMMSRPVQMAESELGQVYYAILDVMGEHE